jgi:ZIP family zinc transporter
MSPIVLGFLVTLLAGLSTGVGSAVSLYSHRSSYRFFAAGLGFAAGVLLFMALAVIFPAAQAKTGFNSGAPGGFWAVGVGFFAGLAGPGLIDWGLLALSRKRKKIAVALFARSTVYISVSHSGAYDEPQTAPFPGNSPSADAALDRTNLSKVWAAAARNIQGGMVTFLAAVYTPGVGGVILAAIVILNIAQGISIAAPIYYVIGERRKAFLLALSCGLSALAGALLAWLLITPLSGMIAERILTAAAAGIMAYLALDGLLSAARGGAQRHQVFVGALAGLALSAVAAPMLANMFGR